MNADRIAVLVLFQFHDVAEILGVHRVLEKTADPIGGAEAAEIGGGRRGLSLGVFRNPALEMQFLAFPFRDREAMADAAPFLKELLPGGERISANQHRRSFDGRSLHGELAGPFAEYAGFLGAVLKMLRAPD